MRALLKQFDLNVLGVLTLLFITAFAFYKNYAAKSSVEEFIRAKKNTALSCVPAESTYVDNNNSIIRKKNSNHHDENNNDQQPPKNGNGCSHPMGGNTICDIIGSKRRSGKGPTC